MSRSRDELFLKIEQLSDEVNSLFVQKADELKAEMLSSFDDILRNDLNTAVNLVDGLIASELERVRAESNSQISKVIKSKFGDSIFGNILSDVVKAGMSGKVNTAHSGGIIRSASGVNSSSGQQNFDFAKMLGRASRRNG